MTENMVEIKKSWKLGYINLIYELLKPVMYVTIVNLLQRQVLTHNEAVHNHWLNFKINW